MDSKKVKKAFKDTLISFQLSMPILLGVILLLGISEVVIPSSYYQNVFTGNSIFDPIIGATFGSLFAGNPITGYIIGGEFLNQGVSIMAVAAFLLAWVTVGVMQMPIEMAILGRKFTLYRAAAAYISAIAAAILIALSVSAVT